MIKRGSHVNYLIIDKMPQRTTKYQEAPTYYSKHEPVVFMSLLVILLVMVVAHEFIYNIDSDICLILFHCCKNYFKYNSRNQKFLFALV